MSVDYAIANTANSYIQGGLEIITSKSGGNVTVTAKLYMRRTNNYSGSTYDNNVSRSITIDGATTSDSGAVTVAGGQQNVWQGPILTASKTFSGSARNITISWATSGAVTTNLNGSGSTGFSVPAGHVAPSGGYVNVISKTYNSVTAKVGVASFGTPNTNKNLELKILEKAYTAGVPARQNSGLANGATTTVTNSSTMFGDSFTIIGNKTYHTGVFASNGALDSRFQGPTFTTPCPPLPTLRLSSQVYSTYNTVKAIIGWLRQSDGGALTRTLKYRYSIDNGSSYSNWIDAGTANASSGSFTIPNLPSSKSIIVQAKLTTSAGDSSTKSLTFSTLSTHAAPNFKDFAFRDDNAKVTALTGSDQVFIERQSIPIVTIPIEEKATGNQNTAMSGYNIAFSGQNYFMDYSDTEDVSKTLLAPTQTSTLVLAVLAVDALQSATQVAKDVMVYPWSEPTIAANITRENGFEASSTLAIKGTYAPVVIDGVAKNSLVVKYRYKKSSSSKWSSWEVRPVVIKEGAWETSNLVKTFDNSSQWDIEVSATDEFTTTTVSLVLSMGIPKFFIGDDGRVSVGKRPEKSLLKGNNGQLEVAGKIYGTAAELTDDVTVNNLSAKTAIYAKNQPLMPTHVGQIIMSTTLDTAAKVAEIYGGTWVTWSAGRVPVGYSASEAEFNAVNKTGGNKSVTLSVAQMPSHNHGVKSLRFKNAWTATGTGSGNWLAPSAYVWESNAQFNDIPITGETRNTGSGNAHSNIQPYITCYFWRRTA